MAEPFISPCPEPNEAEREILWLLAEECAEVVQRAAKCGRFGMDEIQPGQPYTNRERLQTELGDLWAALRYAADQGVLDATAVNAQSWDKLPKLLRFLQRAPREMPPGYELPAYELK